MARNNDITPLKTLIHKMYEEYGLSKKHLGQEIQVTWKETMGVTIAKRTTNMYFKKQLLVVEISSSALKQQLNMEKSKILKLLKERYGGRHIEDVLFI